MKNSKQVAKYWVEKFPSGIYEITFNTKDKWVYFHRYNNEMFQIGGFDIDDGEINDEFIQELPEGLIPQSGHMPTVIQNKDQISFYFIPFDLVHFKNHVVIYESEESGEEIS